jgi:PKD repeat protein
MGKLFIRPALIVLLGLMSACTVQQAEIPSLTGPSEYGLSLGITATPDSISQDGASQSAIVVLAHGPNGAALGGVPVRLDIVVGGVIQDFGSLSTKSIVTGSDGRASAVYVAPPAPPPASAGAGGTVTIVATPTSSDYQTAVSRSVEIRLVPTGVILPPGQTPNPSFTFSPAPPLANVNTTFDASASCPTADPCTSTAGITSFQWNFGDGTTGTGVKATKKFSTPSSYTVTLTVTNDRGIAASTSQTITVGTSDAPSADFVFSPSSPVVGQVVQFNASGSQATPGRSIVKYAWNFGDGDTGTGRTQDHDFQATGTYAVTLTVTDDAGQSATTSNSVTVGSSNPTASFTFAVNGTTEVVTVDAGASTAVGGATIATYFWSWDDGTTTGPSGVAATSHDYTGATPAPPGPYTITLTVTDSLGRTGSTSKNVSVQ